MLINIETLLLRIFRPNLPIHTPESATTKESESSG